MLRVGVEGCPSKLLVQLQFSGDLYETVLVFFNLVWTLGGKLPRFSIIGVTA